MDVYICQLLMAQQAIHQLDDPDSNVSNVSISHRSLSKGDIGLAEKMWAEGVLE